MTAATGRAGHASEDAFDTFISEGYEHGPWGADVVLTGLNLCAETLDGIRNHSWSRPAPGTVEGEIVSWADRIAYCAHDLEDAVHSGIVQPTDLPAEITAVCGRTRRQQLNTFVRAVVRTIDEQGEVGMPPAEAGALAGAAGLQLRADLRATGVARPVPRGGRGAPSPGGVLRRTPCAAGRGCGSRARTSIDPVRAAVGYVAGMTDRYAFDRSIELLGWNPARLPQGVDSAG